MTNKKKNNTKMLWYLIPLLATSFVLSAILLNKHTVNVFKEYPLVKMADAVNEVISMQDDYKSTTLVKTASGKALSIMAYNWSVKPSALSHHIEKGDSISRKPYSDTLYLHKKKDGSIIKFEVQCLE